jgi:ZIP family zinc transporter
VLKEWLGPPVYGATFGLVAGMMVGIVLKELLPTSYRYDPHDAVTTTSLFIGMFVMAISLVMFRV